MQENGHHAILRQFLADGMDRMFGNPGTVEQGFLDALADFPEFHYVLTLQESVAVMTADGYARATHRPTLVQIHSTPGLGNAIGALYQAYRGHSPLVVIGGDAGIKYQAMDAQMAGDLVGMARPVTKWATMVQEPQSLLRVLRRAIKIAATPPMGPVYVCLPQDILDAPATEPVFPTSLPSARVAPGPAQLQRPAEILAAAAHPMIYVGDGIAYSEAQEELARLAELVGALVYEADAGEVNMRHSHPLFQGATGHMFGYQSKPITKQGDVNLICGTYVLPEVFPELDDIFAEGSVAIHIDLDADAIAKNHRVDYGFVSDPKLTLAALGEAVEAIITPAQREAARGRLERAAAEKEERARKEMEQDHASRENVPMQMSRFIADLRAALPDGAMIFDEALTNSPPIARYFGPDEPGSYFLTRGGSLGVGFPGAIGVKIAHPDKTVIGFSGDGGAMYTYQALWTAARHNVNAKFVVCNNGSYRLLQLNLMAYWQERSMTPRDYPLSFDLSQPVLHFADMARSMGVPSVRVEKPWEVAPAIEQMLAAPGPFLIDLVLEGDTHPGLIGITCGQ
jgi:thiamine pyrophosphate-dependent acetolactate synthase large subunit-like protein